MLLLGDRLRVMTNNMLGNSYRPSRHSCTSVSATCRGGRCRSGRCSEYYIRILFVICIHYVLLLIYLSISPSLSLSIYIYIYKFLAKILAQILVVIWLPAKMLQPLQPHIHP